MKPIHRMYLSFDGCDIYVVPTTEPRLELYGISFYVDLKENHTCGSIAFFNSAVELEDATIVIEACNEYGHWGHSVLNKVNTLRCSSDDDHAQASFTAKSGGLGWSSGRYKWD